MIVTNSIYYFTRVFFFFFFLLSFNSLSFFFFSTLGMYVHHNRESSFSFSVQFDFKLLDDYAINPPMEPWT